MLDNTKKIYVSKRVIPNHIVDLSCIGDNMLMAMYLHIKRRTTDNGIAHVHFNTMTLSLYRKKKTTAKTREDRVKSLKNLLLILCDIYGVSNQEIKFNKTFDIDIINMPLIRLISQIKVYLDEQKREFVYESLSELDIETILGKILEYLEENEVKLIDLTRNNVIGFFTIESDLIDFVERYIVIQNSNETILSTKSQLIPTAINNLEQTKERLKIYSGNLETGSLADISYLLLLYCYIAKKYYLNENLGNQTYMGSNTLATTLGMSKKTIILYTNILDNIGLIKMNKPTFGSGKVTQFALSDEWKTKWKDDSTVYKFSIISKADRKQIIEDFYMPVDTTTKRGRGRPKKNNV